MEKLARKLEALRRGMDDSVLPWFGASGKKSFARQTREIAEIVATYRRWPGYYFRYRAYLREPERKSELLPPRLVEKMRAQLNGDCDYDLIIDKRRLRATIEDRGIRTIRELFSKYGPGQFIDVDGKWISAEDAGRLLAATEGDLFIKPLGGSLGKGASVYRKEAAPAFMTDDAAWIVQERISQHAVLDELHPESLNTLRVVTTRTGSQTRVEFMTLRIGTSGAWIDNSQAGGLAAPVDIATGRVRHPATRRYEHDPAQSVHAVHPDTGIAITGLEIPYFQELLELVEAAAIALPEFASVGWDVAILPDGPSILEANGTWGVDLMFRHCNVRETLIGRLTWEKYASARTQRGSN